MITFSTLSTNISCQTQPIQTHLQQSEKKASKKKKKFTNKAHDFPTQPRMTTFNPLFQKLFTHSANSAQKLHEKACCRNRNGLIKENFTLEQDFRNTQKKKKYSKIDIFSRIKLIHQYSSQSNEKNNFIRRWLENRIYNQ